jgi:hypothetical protein
MDFKSKSLMTDIIPQTKEIGFQIMKKQYQNRICTNLNVKINFSYNKTLNLKKLMIN